MNTTGTPKPIRECTRLACTMPPTGSRAQHCTECHEMFAGPYPGDLHRVGKFPDGRRCLTVAEMESAGMSRNRLGYWIGPRHGAGQRARYTPPESPNGAGVV